VNSRTRSDICIQFTLIKTAEPKLSNSNIAFYFEASKWPLHFKLFAFLPGSDCVNSFTPYV